MKRNPDKSWKSIPLLIIVMLMGIFLVWNRGDRHARRVSVGQHSRTSEQSNGRIIEQPGSRAAEQPNNPKVEQLNNQSFVQMDISKAQLLGELDPSRHDDFVPVDARYANRRGMYMHREAYAAFQEMHDAAAQDGVTLTIISAMRTFDHQKRIWQDKWSGGQVLHGNIRATSIADPVARALEILRFSAMPGTSRHHWGTDIDLNSLNNSYFASGQGRKVYDWLQEKAASFGFCQPYTRHGDGRTAGYEEEKWHWSYKPVASKLLEAYRESMTIDDIKGFDGWETAREIGVIERYVMDVNADCQ